MDNIKDEIGIISMIDKSMIISSVVGIVPEFWAPLISFFKMLRLPSPQVLYDVALKYLNQHKEKRNTEMSEENSESGAMTFAAKIVDLQAGGKMSSWDAQSVCVNNIIAGSDTTAISLNCAFYHLFTIPRVLQRLQDELTVLAKKGQISDPVMFQQAQKMPYLQAVINESLRFHSAVGVSLAREVPPKGALIDGYFFPEGVSELTSACST